AGNPALAGTLLATSTVTFEGDDAEALLLPAGVQPGRGATDGDLPNGGLDGRYLAGRPQHRAGRPPFGGVGPRRPDAARGVDHGRSAAGFKSEPAPVHGKEVD